MNNLKLLAISSLPTVGNAGLKNILSLIGEKTIPVPTLIACGLGNMEGHKKIEISFLATLKNSFEMAKANKIKIIVYVGYLYNAEQIDIILNNIDTYRDIIKALIVDPVCGDHGKAYVDNSIINNYHKLLEIADYTLPNETEIRLLSNGDFTSSIKDVIQVFKSRYPKPNHIVTSVVENNKKYNYLIAKDELHPLLFHNIKNVQYAGTGDAFAALFIKYVYFEGLTAKDAIKKTSNYLSRVIAYNAYFKQKAFDLSLIKLGDNYPKKGGKLYYIIGPSGVGKDTLMDIAKNELKNSHVVFAQRYITRDGESGGEDHIPLTIETFKEQINKNFFSLWWKSHGNFYGVGNNINLLLNNGFNVVLNGSRAYHDKALDRYPDMITVLITAKNTTIRQRLLNRGRESIEEIERRLERSEGLQSKFEQKSNVILLSNDSTLDISSKNFIDILLGKKQ